jgi:hypothetical protein
VPSGVCCALHHGLCCALHHGLCCALRRRMLRVASAYVARCIMAYVARCVGVCCALCRRMLRVASAIVLRFDEPFVLGAVEYEGTGPSLLRVLTPGPCGCAAQTCKASCSPSAIGARRRSAAPCSPANAEACARLRKHSEAARRG